LETDLILLKFIWSIKKKEHEYIPLHPSSFAPYNYLPPLTSERKSIETGFKPFQFEEIFVKLDEKKYKDWQKDVHGKAERKRSRNASLTLSVPRFRGSLPLASTQQECSSSSSSSSPTTKTSSPILSFNTSVSTSGGGTTRPESSSLSLSLNATETKPVDLQRGTGPSVELFLPQFTDLEMSFDRRKFTINPLWLYLRRRQQENNSAAPETNRDRTPL